MTLPSKNDRQRLLAERILEAGTVKVEDLLSQFEASPMTIYRDLSELEASNVVTRSRGEVTAVATSLSETSMRYRMSQEQELKASLAKEFESVIVRGASIICDDSSGVYSVLKEFTHIGGLTIITNNWSIMELASTVADWELLVIGGRYSRHLHANLGPAATAFLSQIRADHAIISAAAVSDGTVYHPYSEVADLKRTMMGSAAQSYLLAAHTKFERTALFSVARVDEFERVVVDSGTDEVIVADLREKGASVRVAG